MAIGYIRAKIGVGWSHDVVQSIPLFVPACTIAQTVGAFSREPGWHSTSDYDTAVFCYDKIDIRYIYIIWLELTIE